jgi:hypothetical protein
MLNPKVIEDFLSFPTVINPSSYGQWFECYDWWLLLKFQFWKKNEVIWQIEDLTTFPFGNWGNFEYQNCREFHKLYEEFLKSVFRYEMKELWTVEFDRLFGYGFHIKLIWQVICKMSIGPKVSWVNWFRSSFLHAIWVCKVMTISGPIHPHEI